MEIQLIKRHNKDTNKKPMETIIEVVISIAKKTVTSSATTSVTSSAKTAVICTAMTAVIIITKMIVFTSAKTTSIIIANSLYLIQILSVF